jgi:AhpD family alkylhydroperoxidase
MEARIDIADVAPGVYKAMSGLEVYLRHCGLEESLLHLVKLRASQVNGCAFCLDMHWKDLKAIGESDQRLYSLDAWRETDFYSAREKAALAWTEAVTKLTEGHVPDKIFEEVRAQFSEKEIADLTVAVAAINAWNRISVATRTVPGTYQPAKKKELQPAV